MSDDQFFCEYCGYYSNSRERCTHCGRDIAELFDNPSQFIPPLWGRMTLRIHSKADAERTWKELSEVWRVRIEGMIPYLLPSQMEKFNTRTDTLELYGADFMASIMQEALGERGSVEFQELRQEDLPRRWPPSKPLRPPTVPRNKR